MQPPLDDQQVDHPAHPAGDPDGLAHVSWIDLCACKDPGTKTVKAMNIQTLKATIEKANAKLRSIAMIIG
jgi:hypothetical protein